MAWWFCTRTSAVAVLSVQPCICKWSWIKMKLLKPKWVKWTWIKDIFDWRKLTKCLHKGTITKKTKIICKLPIVYCVLIIIASIYLSDIVHMLLQVSGVDLEVWITTCYGPVHAVKIMSICTNGGSFLRQQQATIGTHESSWMMNWIDTPKQTWMAS